MRVLVGVTVLVLTVSACSTGAPESGGQSQASGSSLSAFPSSTALPPMSTSSPSPGASGATRAPLAGPSDWKVVSSGLDRPGAQVVFDAAQDGQTVVASVLSEGSPGDYDAGLVYSQDGGTSWMWGGVVKSPDRQYPEGVAIIPGGAVIVGSTQIGEGVGAATHAFMATAMAPSFVPIEVPLPKEFDGSSVHLQDVIIVNGEWVVAGYEIVSRDAQDQGQPSGRIWRSMDDGRTWTRQEIGVKGLKALAVKGMAIAPDGSWNLVGQGSNGNVVKQYDAVWLRSTDGGATFGSVSPEKLSGDFDQGANRITFSEGGSAAIVGWDEVTDEHGANVSAMWISSPGHGVQRIGGPRIPVQPTTPLGEFLDGVVWQGEIPVAWGSATGDYPMNDVQFWTLKGAELVATSALPGNGTTLAIARIIPGGNEALALGFVGPEDQGEVTVWRGTLGTRSNQ